MGLARSKRRKIPTKVGMAIRAWPWVRRALSVAWFVRRRWALIRASAIAVALVLVARVIRKRRAGTEAPRPYSVPPASPPGFGGGTRETGYEAGPGTQTERNLEAEKSDGAA